MADRRYRIKSVVHTGTYGTEGEERIDGLYPERKLRTLIIDPDEIEIGRNLFMRCEENYLKSMITSPVKTVTVTGNRRFLRIETRNSVYYMEEI